MQISRKERMTAGLSALGGLIGYYISWLAADEYDMRKHLFPGTEGGAKTVMIGSAAISTALLVGGAISTLVQYRRRTAAERAVYQRTSSKYGCEPVQFKGWQQTAQQHGQRGAYLQAQGQFEKALADYSVAAELDGSNQYYRWQRDLMADRLARSKLPMQQAPQAVAPRAERAPAEEVIRL